MTLPPCPDTPPAWLQRGGLALREFTPADADAVACLHDRPEVRALLVDDYPLHQPAVAELFCRRLAGFYRQHPGLGIWHAGVKGRFVGWFSLMPMVERRGAIELGSRLLPEAWGSGAAMDGGEALLDHAFGTLRAAEVWGACAVANRGARLCLAALGFSADGLGRYDQGLALHHRLSAGDWLACRSRARRERLRDGARSLRGHDALAA